VGPRLFIVDDNVSFLKYARTLLEREGLTVVGVAADGAGALSATRNTEFDVCLVDVDLGGESGAAVARELAKQRPHLHIILISAYSEEDLPGVLSQSPARGFIHKSRLSREAIQTLLESGSNDSEG
jgi:DNA-binding NarL/FixJ family response regulator